tara:strand:- start:147 stop:647 length:501 start_codon:yes stop_codon:yes gene_type:complete
MSIIKDHEVFEAYFTNEERDTITVELVSPDDHETPESTLNVFLYTIPADKTNPDYKALLKKVSEDELYERTVNKFRAEREQFEEMVMNIAKENDEFQTIAGQKGSMEFIQSVVRWIEKDMSEEDLFRFKLNLFETETVQKSKAKTKKANLRKATTAKEAFKIFLDF